MNKAGWEGAGKGERERCLGLSRQDRGVGGNEEIACEG